MRARRWLLMPLVGLIAIPGACTETPPPPVVSSPVASTTTPEPEEPASKIVVGLEHLEGGYNPHRIADSSTVTSALATLLLPSVFRPAGDESGKRVLDTSVMKSAKVTSRDPFTVSYVIRDDASWSDGAPIAAEDFIYLADAMQTQPGVVKPAGYRLITDIRSTEGGKHVEVEFARAYPAWRTLFDNLLPAHLLKDAPGGWADAFATSFPASGGPFAIKSIDLVRGQIVLQRNERYWGDPANVDQIVLRRTDQQSMVAALRSGTIQLAMASTDATGVRLFNQLGEKVQLHTVVHRRVASVILRPGSQQLARQKVRAAVAALMNRDALIDIGTAGGPSADLRANAQVRAPSEADYQPSMPANGVVAKQAPKKAAELLREAGYTREDGFWRKNGKKLTLVIATPGTRQPYTRIAEAIAGQLAAAGIDVRTVHPKPRALFAGPLATRPGADGSAAKPAGGEKADIAVVPQATGSDAATVLASRFGCASGKEKPSQDTKAGPVGASAAAFCGNEDVQDTIRAALTGKLPVSEALAELEPKLWSSHVVIPLFQLADTLAVGTGIKGVDPGTPKAGPFESAVNWRRVPA